MTLFPQHTLDAVTVSPQPLARRSAGTAWLLSLVLPGAGQLYCGAKTRGMATMAWFIIALITAVFVRSELLWLGLRTMIMLYAFAGLDAYATAVENNSGIEADAADNPRVAAILNLTTNGFGYVYLGWKFGFGTFLALFFFWRSVGSVLPALGEAVAFGMAAHAYFGARRERAAVYPAAKLVDDSRVPRPLPWVASGLILGLYALLVLAVQVVLLLRMMRG